MASTLVARAMGGKVGGIFAAFPAVYLAAILTVGMELKGNAALTMSQHVSQGALVGMLADIVCAIAASYFIARKGWKKGLISALVIWFFTSTAIYLTWTNFIA